MHEKHGAVAAVVLLGLSATMASGQEQPENPRKNSLERGAWAIQFQITEEIGLKPFNGMMISLKRHFSEGSALRLGANLNLSYDDTNWNQSQTPADTLLISSNSTQEQSGQSVQLDLMYMGYPNPRAPVNFFWGSGPLIRYSRGHSESEGRQTAPADTLTFARASDSHSWQVGVLGAAGVEWFATRGISFHAEYRARVAYGRSEAEESIADEGQHRALARADRESWEFSAVEVILGLSVYF